MMTKQNFVRFAAAIRKADTDETTKRFMVDIVEAAQDNPAFDVTRFMSACGLMSQDVQQVTQRLSGRKVTR